MPKSKPKTTRYYSLLVYSEHFSLDALIDKLNTYSIPYVISPLHSPVERKPHYHVILDNTESALPTLFIRSIATALCCPNCSYQDVRNIISAEKYLRHETADSAHKQQFSKDENLTFGLGYELHKNTYVGDREMTSLLVAYITDNLSTMCISGEISDLPSLLDVVKKPEFYADFDEPVSYKTARCKGINEVKTHFRFYLSLTENAQKSIALKENALDVAEIAEINGSLLKFCTDVLQNDIDDNTARVILQKIYYNNRKFRSLIKENGGLCNPRVTLNAILRCKSVDTSFLTCFSNYIDSCINGISF